MPKHVERPWKPISKSTRQQLAALLHQSKREGAGRPDPDRLGNTGGGR
jgi:hypothetical protein